MDCVEIDQLHRNLSFSATKSSKCSTHLKTGVILFWHAVWVTRTSGTGLRMRIAAGPSARHVSPLALRSTLATRDSRLVERKTVLRAGKRIHGGDFREGIRRGRRNPAGSRGERAEKARVKIGENEMGKNR